MELRKPLVALLVLPLLLGAAPSRTQTYVSGQVINPSHVTENEDNIYAYLQAGVDTYATGSVTSSVITDGTILNIDIGSSAAIAYSKLTLTNSITGADIALGSDAQGDLMYYDGTNWARLGAGTSGQFLKTQGAGANPAWESVATVADRVQRTAGDVATTSTTLVDFTGASITLTTGANPVLIGFEGLCFHDSVGQATRFNLDVDGTDILGAVGQDFEVAVASDKYNCSFAVLSADLTAGSHTIKLQWSTISAGTATVNCDGDEPCTFWVVEVND